MCCATIQLPEAVDKIKANIIAIQEIKWVGQGCSNKLSAIYIIAAMRRDVNLDADCSQQETTPSCL